MKKFKSFISEVKKPTGDLKNACWKGYTAVGMKMKNGRKVPNCVPNNEETISEVDRGDHEWHQWLSSRPKKPGHYIYHNDEPIHKEPLHPNKAVALVSKMKGAKPDLYKNLEIRQVKEDTSWYPKKGFPKEGEYGYHPNPGLKPQESDKDQDMDVAYKKENEKEAPKLPNARIFQIPNKIEKVKEEKSNREYDYEGDMAMSQLKSIIANAQKLHDMLKPDTNLPEWVQSKITLAEDYVVTVANYMNSELDEEIEQLDERGADSKGYFRSTESGAGLTPKGAKHFGIKTAVTTPPSKLKKGGKAWNRRKSFCARMSGMKGPMKDEKGRPTRKAMSLRRWNCHEETED